MSAGSTDSMVTLAEAARAPLNTSFFATNGCGFLLWPPAKAGSASRLIHAGTNDVRVALQDEHACETFVVRETATRYKTRAATNSLESPLVLAQFKRTLACGARVKRRSSRPSPRLETHLGSGSRYSGSIIKIRPTAATVVTKMMMFQERTRSFHARHTLLLGRRPPVATLEMVQRGAIVKEGRAVHDYALDVVQGDGSGGRRRGVDHCAHKGRAQNPTGTRPTPFHLHTNHFQVVGDVRRRRRL